MTVIDELKGRVGEGVAAACGDTLLEQMITTVGDRYGTADRTKLLDLVQADVCLRMATDAALYFKYSQGAESIDKSMTTENFLAVAKALWMKNGVEGQGAGGEGVISVNRTRRTEEL